MVKTKMVKTNDEISDYFDEFDGGLEDLPEYLEYLENNNLTVEQVGVVFAMYLLYGEIDLDIIDSFVGFGLDINQFNSYYDSDAHWANPLFSMCEYRRDNNIKALLDYGADASLTVTIHDKSYGLIDIYLMGHNPFYTQIESEKEYQSVVYGLKLLIDHGASVTDFTLDYLEEEYPENEYTERLICYLQPKLIK